MKRAAPGIAPLEQAAEWFALLRSGEATAAERAAWQAWHDACEAHTRAWAQVESVGRLFLPIRQSEASGVAATAYRRAEFNSGRRRTLLGIGALAAAGVVGHAAWRHNVLYPWAADYRSGTGEVREVVLDDGTRVWLGTASAFDQHYSAGLRRLELIAGEILISTAPDASRPFVVDTPQGRLRALGTRFSVRRDDGGTDVAVYQGSVQANAPSGAQALLLAGWRARMTRQGISAPRAADPDAESSTRGLFIAKNIPLADMARELSRYRLGHVGVAPDVAALPVFGSFPMTDPDRTLNMLESVLPVRVRMLPWWVDILPR
ncbi:FecR family protein [Bordetella holmesii]|uniref:Sigma factor regulatory protein, FecR/PupR family n=1 Tax=Bordetella holmesii CDC-H585-BH TaxID=1331206 RepID=A0A158M5F9_9BORD|nr:FecR family protein [Bordetella holmesii]AMD47176.1 iron dicitrate transport regulator FecR [Bordetella holmesii H558]KAK76699.1 sigma factor regulatory protein, FecR/PupR family [Bordetella holmesii H620]KAK84746.1 sigma factor regulatory protein, FecR/PupR family [Bordetella holmesii CDC-H572-BH]KCV01947.1 sigma factor regulatory protein, FecR/PupR family [Bordetella holmesii CDC-H719-BH]KCV06344.1 sigma factor regulatory protein, FecR/PupR family [Bordetella holmesii CDC-H629-BH]KCV1639